jgi:hypothetical protein
MELSRLSSLALCWDGYKLRADRVQDCGEAKMRFLSIVAFLMLLAGCAGDSAPRIDWQARIDHYTLDDAKRDLGVPESCVGLDDEGTACSWTTSKGRETIDKLVLTFNPASQLTTANNVHF